MSQSICNHYNNINDEEICRCEKSLDDHKTLSCYLGRHSTSTDSLICLPVVRFCHVTVLHCKALHSCNNALPSKLTRTVPTQYYALTIQGLGTAWDNTGTEEHTTLAKLKLPEAHLYLIFHFLFLFLFLLLSTIRLSFLFFPSISHHHPFFFGICDWIYFNYTRCRNL